MIRRRGIAVAVALAIASTALADEPPEGEASYGGQRGVGFGINLGLYKSMGLGARLGWPRLGVEVGGGWGPSLAAYTSDLEPHLLFLNGYQLDADVSIFLMPVGPHAQLGASPGYRYNTELGHGLAVGGYAELSFSSSLGFRVHYGILVYPGGTARARQRDDVPNGAEFGFPGPALQGGIGFGIVLYP